MTIQAPWGKVDRVVEIWLEPFVQWKLCIVEAQISKDIEFMGKMGQQIRLVIASMLKETKKAAKSKNENK